jgi:penicillin-binding protein 2
MAQLESSTSSTALRLTFLSLVVIGLLAALFARLWFLQVLAEDRYIELAEQNRVRPVVVEAPRGRILDRHGEELVKNRPALTVSADRQRLLTSAGEPRSPEAEAVLDRLSVVLEMPRGEIVERLMSRRYSPYRAIPIKEDVAPEIIFHIKERQELFPGIVAEMLPVRTYPHGNVAAHVVGYLGEITDAELEQERFKDHRPGDLVGKAGLEASYEHVLHGQAGWVRLEATAAGTVVRELSRQHPVPGSDLVTTLDLELQQATEQILHDGMVASRNVRRPDGRFIRSTAGAVVVIDPRDGAVRAMASSPTYDPMMFSGGISADDWAWLHDPDNRQPLLNRAIQWAAPPGSVYKIVTGASVMEAGLIGPNNTLPCPPVWTGAGRPFRNWNRAHDGQMDAARALMRSCDTYYYPLAFRQWQREEAQVRAGEEPDEAIQRMSREFSLGQRTGIDLPSESAGVIPDRAWRLMMWERLREVYCAGPGEGASAYLVRLYRELCVDGGVWRGGDAVNMSIGQGDVLTTPLQMAVATAAVANGGTVWRPHLGLEVIAPDGTLSHRSEPEALGEVPLTEPQMRAIQRGLEMVVSQPGGTAHRPFLGFPIPSAGKTGTAEKGDRIPYAWYVGYAPVDEPRYVVAVAVEEGSGGSVTAAPIARRVLEAAFGLPVSPFQAGPPTN